MGDYTPDARRFAEGKPIELINGVELVDLIRAVQTSAGTGPHREADADTKQRGVESVVQPEHHTCPRCGSAMIERTARNTGAKFLGCSTFPACRMTRQLS